MSWFSIPPTKGQPALGGRRWRSACSHERSLVITSAMRIELRAGSVLATLFFIQADQIATVLDDDFYDFQGRGIFGRLLPRPDLLIVAAIGQDPLPPFLHLTQPPR